MRIRPSATHSQKTGPMCDASQQLAEAIAEGRIRHPDDAGLNAHVLAAAAKFIGVGWRLVKPTENNLPIDAAVALAMAIRVLNAIGGQASCDHDHILDSASGVLV
jgi:phage terminase large subunit-like protein